MQVKIKQMQEVDGAMRMPRYMSEGASGADLCAVLDEPREISPGGVTMILTGIAIEIPPGFEAQVRPRSGLSGQGILAVLGTIDSDYRGEIGVTLHNTTAHPFFVVDGMRIAQLVIAPVTQADFSWSLDLAPTRRGERGFGSTGMTTTVHQVGPLTAGRPADGEA